MYIKLEMEMEMEMERGREGGKIYLGSVGWEIFLFFIFWGDRR